MTNRHVRSDGKKQIERLRGRPTGGQVPEFAEVNHFRDTQRAAGTSKLYDEWSLREWMEQILVSDGHDGGAPTRVGRCRSVWKCPEDPRWVKRVLNEMIGDPWSTSPRWEEKPRIKCGVRVTLERQIRYGGQKGCMACCRHAGANPRDMRTRSQDIVNNEVAQTDSASSNVSPGQTAISLSSDPAQSSSSGTAPEVGNLVVVTVAESSTTQPTTRSTIGETETRNQSRDKRQRVLTGRPDRTGVDVNACRCRTIVLAADPEDRDGWTQQVMDWNKKRPGAKTWTSI